MLWMSAIEDLCMISVICTHFQMFHLNIFWKCETFNVTISACKKLEVKLQKGFAVNSEWIDYECLSYHRAFDYKSEIFMIFYLICFGLQISDCVRPGLWTISIVLVLHRPKLKVQFLVQSSFQNISFSVHSVKKYGMALQVTLIMGHIQK